MENGETPATETPATGAKAPSGRWSRILEITGRTLLTTGLLMLAFVVYQLWGTGIHESRAQDDLKNEFAAQMSTTTSSSPIPTTTTEPKRPAKGKVVGRIQAPAMGLDKYVVAGVSAEMLKMGPGLFPKSPLPGQRGNVAITGHRTTYGAPFGTIHYLKPGDLITITTTRGVFNYKVNAEPRIILPSKTSVIRTTDRTRSTLTLISCHPRWSSERRIVVTADLISNEEAAAATSTTVPATSTTLPALDGGAEVTDDEVLPGESLSDGWFHDTSTIPEVVFYGLILIAIAVVATTLVKRGRRRVVVYPPALVVFIILLYPFFENLSGLLPSNL